MSLLTQTGVNRVQLRNNSHRYGLLAIFLHWSMTILIIALFFLGEYMVDLDYYDSWYQAAPDLHRSFGVIAAILLILRLLWRLGNVQPAIIGKPWEQQAARWVHRLFYALIIAIVISGYFITTADGQGISVFNWFEIPASFQGFENQEDIAGEFHEWLTHILILLVGLHTLAALKHHFFNHDTTLSHMLGLSNPEQMEQEINQTTTYNHHNPKG